MECARVRQLLSEYIDTALDTKIASIVEEHLEKCKDCSKEHASLNTLVNALGQLETVETPSDFLEKVHKRIEADSWLERVKHFLFFPARVKIPVELTALATAAVLVFIIFHTIQDNKLGKDLPSGTSETMVAVRSGNDSRETATNRPVVVETGSERDQGVIHLALSLEPIHKEKPLSSENIISVASGARQKSRETPGLSLETIRQEQNVSEPEGLVSNLKDIVSGIEGRLLSKEYKIGTDYPLYITIEIPAINYQVFLEKTGRIGSFQASIPSLPYGYKGRVRIQIQVISSN
ncbi:anti-sigma factor family protein [Thermodesulfobacteriota bacterium]